MVSEVVVRTPLFQRLGEEAPFELSEDIQIHQHTPLVGWARQVLTPKSSIYVSAENVAIVATQLHVFVSESLSGDGRFTQLINACERDSRLYLTMLDILVGDFASNLKARELNTILRLGHSAWEVSAERELQRRVGGAAGLAYQQVQQTGGDAAKELSEAWSKVYGLQPDPSDAWDHAIKAVEAALVPIVVPKSSKATLGSVLTDLRQGGDKKWRFEAPGSKLDNSVVPLLGVLEILWPNPDRHAGNTRRAPTQVEAETIVQLATTVVQWATHGAIVLR